MSLMKSMKKVAVIGAGAAGLASARHLIANGFECTVFELAPELGGTWLYTDDVGTDKYGFPVYSAMYKGLKTNLPKEVMGFPDFPISSQTKSYLTQAEILMFLKEYANEFNLRDHIKFNHHVVDVVPCDNNRWRVHAIDKPTNQRLEEVFDAVMICNGHYNDPVFPELEGDELFLGQIMHSHQYREPKGFQDKRVLVVGAGPSGLDLALQISRVAQNVVLSHHCKELKTKYPENVALKPDVERVVGANRIRFIDDTEDDFDVIFYCTGYRYSFPFLHKDCRIEIVENHIAPLYKHMVNIEMPTMCFIGIPFNVCAFQMFDLQARFFVASLNGVFTLPSKELMYADLYDDLQQRENKGYTKRQAHLMGPDQFDYYEDLAKQAKTTPIPPVIVKLRDESVKRLYDDLINFRDDNYKILNDNTFVKVN